LDERAGAALRAVGRADSVTLDPHKLGYVPFASGALLVRTRRDYFVRGTVAPYVQFDESADKGPYTVEGSRSSCGAAATWMTARTTGLDAEGYGRILRRTLLSKRKLEAALRASGLPIRIAPGGDSNILCFTVAPAGEALTRSNERVDRLYRELPERKENPFFVSMTRLGWEAYGPLLRTFVGDWGAVVDAREVHFLRICIMNPFFDSIETKTDFLRDFVGSLEDFLGREAIRAERVRG
jgi:glutamate/tyrosine decarboxylase-like PLP-dependent enzyme